MFCFLLLLLYCTHCVSLLAFESLLVNKKCQQNGKTVSKSLSCQNLTKVELNILFERLNGTAFIDSLESLSIQKSQLASLNLLPKLKSLKKLDLSNNLIAELSNLQQISFKSVAHFDISGNSIRLLSHDAFSLFPNLEVIHLENNKIMSIDWEAFRLFRLKEMHLQNNYLPVISEHMLRFTPNLEFLNLSQNQLTIVQSSSFYAAQRLAYIDLSHNRIQQFKYDSFSALDQVSWLDLSFNNLSTLPGLDLKQIIGLKVLNLSGNPFQKLVAGDISLPALERLDINACPRLKLIEAGSFSILTKLKQLYISNNQKLVFISPSSLMNISQLDEINLTNNSLPNIGDTVFNSTKKIWISGNPLNCNCLKPSFNRYSSKIQDAQRVDCKQSNKDAICQVEPFLPSGKTLTAKLGSCFSIYCSSTTFSSTILWTLPNGSQSVGNQSDFVQNSWASIMDKNHGLLPFLSNTDAHAEQEGTPSNPEHFARVTATNEQLKFDAILPEDAGPYKCTVGSNTANILLELRTPAIAIRPLEVGSHFVTVAWNDSLKICAYNRVNSFLTVQDNDGITRRYTRLSLHNPWLSYNVMRLKPLQNYTICLLYAFVDGPKNRNIYETCTTIKTKDSVSFWTSFNFSVLMIILSIPLFIWAIVALRAMYYKLHIWHDTTVRAKMNQSISGQSFLSRSSSTHDHVLSPSATFGNNSERAVQATRMSVLGPLVEEDGYALEYENNAAV